MKERRRPRRGNDEARGRDASAPKALLSRASTCASAPEPRLGRASISHTPRLQRPHASAIDLPYIPRRAGRRGAVLSSRPSRRPCVGVAAVSRQKERCPSEIIRTCIISSPARKGVKRVVTDPSAAAPSPRQTTRFDRTHLCRCDAPSTTRRGRAHTRKAVCESPSSVEPSSEAGSQEPNDIRLCHR